MKKDSKITLFRNYRDTDPVADLTVFEFCDYIKNSPEFVNEIAQLRDPKVSKAERDKLKAKLPALTISGTFSKREAASLINHSGFICLDLDSGSNEIEDWPGVRDSMMDIENVYFSALSASGQGVFCLVPIAFPHRHKEQAIQLMRDFEKATGLRPDQSCKDVCRLRGISHDPDAKFNDGAISYSGVYHEPIKKPPSSYHTKNHSPLETAKKMIREAVTGSRHETILKAAVLLGGYIAAGQLNESEAISLLRDEAENKLPSQRHQGAYKTIRDGIEHGKGKPIQK